MKTAISIPDAIFEAAERVARKLGISRSELYARAVAQLVDAYNRDEVTARLDAVYADEPSELDPVLAEMQFHVMDHEDW